MCDTLKFGLRDEHNYGTFEGVLEGCSSCPVIVKVSIYGWGDLVEIYKNGNCILSVDTVSEDCYEYERRNNILRINEYKIVLSRRIS